MDVSQWPSHLIRRASRHGDPPLLSIGLGLDYFVHKSLGTYALIAATGTRETLTALIDIVRTDNNPKQERLDTRVMILGGV